MKSLRTLYVLALLLLVCTASTLKKGDGKVFAFGVAASFTDTVLYYTEIQELDSVKLKNGFLPQRGEYSLQLQDYVEGNGLMNQSTCMIYFSENRAKLEKEANKVLGRYKKAKNIQVNQIKLDEFKFQKPEPEE